MIMLYSSVRDVELFKRVGFYRDDIRALALQGAPVEATNSLVEIITTTPKILVGYFYTKSLLAAMIGRVLGSKVILTGGADQISPMVYSGLRLLIHKICAFFCLIFADRVLLSCTEDIKNFRKLAFGFEVLSNKIQFAPHVVEFSAEVASFNRDGPVGLRCFTICWMGSIENVKRKGIDRALYLISRLRGIGVDATLEIAGTDGPGAKYLKPIIKKLKIEKHVTLLGPITDTQKNMMFSNGSFYIQLSTYEGFGLAAAEAFLAGAVVIHSNRGGLLDVINSRGYVVDIDGLLDWDDATVREFYESVLSFRVDISAISRLRYLYSIQRRANSFLNM